MTDALVGLLDGVVTAAGRWASGLPVSLAVRPSWEAVRQGRLALIEIHVEGVSVGGLRLSSVRARVHDLGVQWADGLEVVTGSTEVTIVIDQHDLDAWSRRLALPARLVMRDGRLVARFGVAGVRLAQVEMEVQAADGGLRLSPRRLAGAGVDIRTATELAVRIPLPRMPVSPSLTSAHWQDGSGTIRFVLPTLSIPLNRETLRRVGDARQRMTAGPETSGRGQAAVSRNGWARTPRSTGLSGREASPAFST